MVTIERRGGATVIRPDRPLQCDSLSTLSSEMSGSMRGGIPLIVMDLSATPLIDSAGLEWLLDLDDECCDRGGSVCLCNANELCRDILRITSVGATIRQFPDLTTALGSLSG